MRGVNTVNGHNCQVTRKAMPGWCWAKAVDCQLPKGCASGCAAAVVSSWCAGSAPFQVFRRLPGWPFFIVSDINEIIKITLQSQNPPSTPDPLLSSL